MRIGQLDEIQELLDDGARIVERWRVARGGGEERRNGQMDLSVADFIR
jgi:hypothetical protein